MDPILLFFIIPIATIVGAIALEKLLNSPILVGAITFTIFLILSFTILTTNYLILGLIYSILATITAFITNFFDTQRRFKCKYKYRKML
jgi:hypothetical protein